MATIIPDCTTPLAISTRSTWPNVAPTDATLEGSVFSPQGGNALEVYGKCSANTGALYLLRYHGFVSGSHLWFPVDVDAKLLKAVDVDATKLAGYFSGPWLTGDLLAGGSADYCVYQTGTATFERLFVAARRI